MNENNAHAKLTWDSVEEIRKESNRSIRASVFAKKYGVVKETIFSVRKNKTWIKDSGPVQ
jgi:DNA-binding transcriptional regulator YiaG